MTIPYTELPNPSNQEMKNSRRSLAVSPIGTSRIARRMTLLVLLFSSMITLIGTSTQFYLDYRQEMDGISVRFEEIRYAHLDSILKQLWLTDDDGLLLQLEGILRLPDMQFLEIVRPNARTLTVGKQGAPINVIEEHYPLRHFYRGNPIEMGLLRAQVNLDQVHKRLLDKLLLILVTQSIKTFLVSFFVLAIFYQLVGRHLISMEKQTRSVRLGSTFTFLTLPRPPSPANQIDELDHLVAAINHMGEQSSVLFRELQEQETFQRAILENALDAIITVDLHGKITAFNPAAESLFGFHPEDVLGKDLIECIVPPEFHRQHQDALAHWAECTDDDFSFARRMKFPGLRADGQRIDMHFAVIAVRSMGKRYFTAFVQDITDRKQLLKSLDETLTDAEASSRAKSEFLANMSHEIRTPMNAIVGLTDLALDTDLTPKVRDYLTKAANASRSLLRIINDILDFSKIDAGKFQLESIDFLLCDVFDHLSDLFYQKAVEQGIELIIQSWEECRYALTGDCVRIEQILVNLVGNSIKFTEKGEIEVGVRIIEQRQPDVVLEFFVRDTGIGLSQDQIVGLFTPFMQADGSITRKYGGTGLGLSICKQLVEMMNGKILVESTLGSGSVFRFTIVLPRREEAEYDISRVCLSD
ncbi:MAG: PAS domain S-box protein, partial [Magnetococcales bacterium]|nr:PAS domain S-box protein [Magnetococcales bacterium]